MLAILAMTDGKMTATDIPAVLLHETGKNSYRTAGRTAAVSLRGRQKPEDFCVPEALPRCIFLAITAKNSGVDTGGAQPDREARMPAGIWRKKISRGRVVTYKGG
jgi:hypothetical protein